MSQQDLATPSDSNGDQKRDKVAPVCPACGSKLTRRSMRRSWKDRFKSAFGLWPYRCQLCYTRFTGPQDPEEIVKYNANAEEEARDREEAARFLEEEASERKEAEAQKRSEDNSRRSDKK